MTWSLQLTPWALPPLLAVLVLLREVVFVWPRRREPGALTMTFLAAATAAWALLQLGQVVSPPLPVKISLARLQYVAAGLAPIAWARLSLQYAQRLEDLRRWPMLLLYAVSVGTLVLVAWPGGHDLLVRSARLSVTDGYSGLVVELGWWHWVAVAARAAAVFGSAWMLAGTLARSPGSRAGALIPVAAAVIAVGSSLAPSVGSEASTWTDLSATGFALGSALLSHGLVRRRLINLGPVARTLVLDELRDALVVLDAHGRIVDVNRTAERVLGLRPYGDVPVALGMLWASSRLESVVSTISLHVTGEGRGDGEGERVFEVTVTSLHRGAPGRAALLLRDVTERERMERELRRITEALTEANRELDRLARTDVLTELANRRQFMEVLAGEMERAVRYGRTLSLVMIDLDHFKSVNDTHGHAAGDQVLRQAAKALRAVSRDVDLCARIGGEELALLLPETDGEGAYVVAERLRESIEQIPHRSPAGKAFRVTASLGIASVGKAAMTGAALIQLADQALYRAKEARNRVVLERS